MSDNGEEDYEDKDKDKETSDHDGKFNLEEEQGAEALQIAPHANEGVINRQHNVDGRTLENGWTRCAEQTNYLVEMCISPG
jgi:hypothetical protein